MQTKYFLSMFIFLSVNFSLFSQSFDYNKAWKELNMLEKKAMPAKALEASDAILQAAEVDANSQQLLRCLLKRSDLRSVYQEDAMLKTIAELEKYLGKAKGVDIPLLQIALAEVYTVYFNNNQWKIHQIKLLSSVRPASVKEWSAADFLGKIDSLYVDALAAKRLLQANKSKDWAVLFERDDNKQQSFEIQPQLYDLVLWKALNYYAQKELCDMSAEEAFVLNNPAFLQPYSQFKSYIVPKRYVQSHKAKLIQIFQTLLQQHKDNSLAFLYTESRRLQYFKENILIDNVNDKLLATYKSLYQTYKTQKGVEWIAEDYILLLENMATEKALQQAADICQFIKQQQPQLHFFKQKWAQLHQANINLAWANELTDDVLLPHQANLLYVTANNTTHLWFRIIPLSVNDNLLQAQRHGTIDYKNYSQRIALTSFSQQLWDKAHLSEKTAVVALPSLSYGAYVLLVSNQENFEKAQMLIKPFWISELRLLSQSRDGKYILVNRNNGKPIVDAKVEVYSSHWREAGSLIESLRTDKQGAFNVSELQKAVKFKISKEKDYWESAQTYHSQMRPERQQERHYIFTDRAIYRPGQRVYFKAILTTQINDSIAVLSDKEIRLRFYNTQGKEIAQKSLRSNAYGSVSGYFDCPTKGLNGDMRISSEKGNVQLRMEAYKRPKFDVRFEEPTSAMRLGDSIKAEGAAHYYMGAAVANAKVAYRVERTAHQPWWRRGYHMPLNAKSLPITAGTVSTDDKGTFVIPFKAEAADKSMDYRYKVMVDVIDASGELQSEEYTYTVGEKALLLYADMPTIIDKAEAHNIAVHIRNLQHKTIASDWKISISSLKAEDQRPLRLRTPIDKILVGEYAQSKDFPLVCFDTSLYHAQVEKEVYQATIKAEQLAQIQSDIWRHLDVGHYRCTLSAIDAFGQKVENSYDISLIASNIAEVPPMRDMQLFTAKSTLQQGDTYRFVAVMPSIVAPIYYQICSGTKFIDSGWKTDCKPYMEWTGKVQSAYRGGLSLQLFYAANGSWYHSAHSYIIPYENKALDIHLESFRSNLEPGAQERWQVKITDHHKKGVEAELMAAMYDKSLDALVPHQWQWQLFPQKRTMGAWRSFSSFLSSWDNTEAIYPSPMPNLSLLEYNWRINTYGFGASMYRSRGYAKNVDGIETEMAMAAPMASNVLEVAEDEKVVSEELIPVTSQDDKEQQTLENRANPQLSMRKNLQETAFFYPQLHSNAQGELQISFQAPDALTEWKLMLLAHTPQMQHASTSKLCKTQKELMVLPHLPRFFRGGDQIALSARILSAIDKAQIVNAKVEMIDPNTGQLIKGGNFLPRQFELLPEGQTEVAWKWQVPDNIGAVIVRMYAQGAKHQDAEEQLIPVLSPLMYLTNSYPFSLYGTDSLKSADLHLDHSQKMKEERFTFEVVSNPLWYVVQALPNYSKPKHPSALSWAHYYFIQSMGKHVIDVNPSIATVFAQWQKNEPAALQSKLHNNQKLKTLLLEQTPWVLEADNEAERKRAIADYFQDNQCAYAMQEAVSKLVEMQEDKGGWSWFEGIQPSPFITAQIIQLIGHLEHEALIDMSHSSQLQKMSKKAIAYLDNVLIEHYNESLNQKLSYAYATHIISARALFLDRYPLSSQAKRAYEYFVAQWQKDKHQLSVEAKRHLAEVLLLSGDKKSAQALALSIADHALRDADGAMYWRDFAHFRSAEQQARTLLLFEKLQMSKDTLKAMKLWLLKQKRTQDWGDKEGTAWACFAMLKEAPQLIESPKVKLWIDGKLQEINGRSGSGYYKQSWQGNAVEIAQIKASLKVEVEAATDNDVVFGAIYHQGFVPAQNVEAHQGGMRLDKHYLLASHNEKKMTYTQLSEVKDVALGSTLIVRMRFSSEQAMDYVHLSDALPSGFEVKEPLSAYKYQNGLSFYRAINDERVDFFISHLPKGDYMLEYELNVSAQGVLNVGPARIQSAYAPEFGAHSKGASILTKPLGK